MDNIEEELKKLNGTLSEFEETTINTLSEHLSSDDKAKLYQAVKDAKDKYKRGISSEDILAQTKSEYNA